MLQNNTSLKNYNTMKIDVNASYFSVVKNPEQLKEVLSKNHFKNILVIGSGSNILFTKDFDGLVIKNEIPGIKILSEDEYTVQLKAGAGVIWHELVMHCVENNWSGIENLALIPGTVGAAPVQNIGAYGQEIKDVIIKIDAYEIASLNPVTFLTSDCRFSYRNSIFKQHLKNEYILESVTLELKKHFDPVVTYPPLSKALKVKNIVNPSMKQIAETVIEIRQSKLPDYFTLSNCGSFFTNPFLTGPEFSEFSIQYPNAPFFPFEKGFKLSAGWLIEQCGWKGKRIGNVGCYEHHALVIVNYGGATGSEIYRFSTMVRDSVYEKFGVVIQYEVNIL